MAIAAVDIALWDIKARLLGISLARLFGRARESVPVYGSGGFTNYDDAQLKTQLGGWARDGICALKIEIGSDPHDDRSRVLHGSLAVVPAIEIGTAAMVGGWWQDVGISVGAVS